MKLFIKFLVFVLVLGLAGPFLLKGPDGRPLMDAHQLVPDVAAWPHRLERWWNRMLREGEILVEEGPAAAGKTRVYKWRSEDGSWRFSDTPNPQGQSEEVWVDPNGNVMQSTPPPAQTGPGEKEAAQGLGNGIPLPLTVTPGQASKLLDDARKVQALMDRRDQALQEVLGERSQQE